MSFQRVQGLAKSDLEEITRYEESRELFLFKEKKMTEFKDL